MAKLRDVRRRFPPDDRDAYDAAYAEATLAGEVGAMLHAMRTGAGLGEADLAARVGVGEDEVVLAEEGGLDLTLGYLDRVALALGSPVTITAGETAVVLGRSATPGAT